MAKMGPKLKKLTVEEAAALKRFCQDNGGQEVVAVSWGFSSSRITRAINRDCAPQPKFRLKLIEAGIVKVKGLVAA